MYKFGLFVFVFFVVCSVPVDMNCAKRLRVGVDGFWL